MENEGGELEEIKSRRQRPRQRANRGGKQRKCVCVRVEKSERRRTNCPKGALIQNLI